MRDLIKPVNSTYGVRYVNYRRRQKTNEELYEGNIRSDFSSTVFAWDSIEIIKLPQTGNPHD